MREYVEQARQVIGDALGALLNLTGETVDLSTATKKAMAFLSSLGKEMERENAVARAKAAAYGRHVDGKATGRAPWGYRLRRVAKGTAFLEKNPDTRNYYLRNAAGRLDGRPELESPYLLAGLFRYEQCGGPITAKGARYYCDRRINRGELTCATFLSERREAVDQAIIGRLTGFLDADLIEMTLDEAVTKHAGNADRIEADKATAAADLAKVEAEITRTVGLVVKGIIAEDEAAASLKDARDRKAILQARVEHLDGQGIATRIDHVAFQQQIAPRLGECKALLAENPIKARQIVKRLIPGTGRLRALPDGTTRFEFEASYGKLVSGIIGCSDPALSASETSPQEPLRRQSRRSNAEHPTAGALAGRQTFLRQTARLHARGRRP